MPDAQVRRIVDVVGLPPDGEGTVSTAGPIAAWLAVNGLRAWVEVEHGSAVATTTPVLVLAAGAQVPDGWEHAGSSVGGGNDQHVYVRTVGLVDVSPGSAR